MGEGENPTKRNKKHPNRIRKSRCGRGALQIPIKRKSEARRRTGSRIIFGEIEGAGQYMQPERTRRNQKQTKKKIRHMEITDAPQYGRAEKEKKSDEERTGDEHKKTDTLRVTRCAQYLSDFPL